MNILLTLILLVLITFGGAAWLLVRRARAVAAAYESEIRDYAAQFQEFISPGQDGKPSPLAQSAEILSEMMARAFMAQFKATLMGMRSGEIRSASAEAGGQAVEAAQGLLPGIAGMPGVSKALKKNPGLLDLALRFLPQLAGAGAPDNGNHGGSNGGPPRFHL